MSLPICLSGSRNSKSKHGILRSPATRSPANSTQSAKASEINVRPANASRSVESFHNFRFLAALQHFAGRGPKASRQELPAAPSRSDASITPFQGDRCRSLVCSGWAELSGAGFSGGGRLLLVLDRFTLAIR